MTSSKSSPKKPNYLAPGFQPGNNHVVVCRGKKSIEHQGNQKLRLMVKARVQEYSEADKVDKTFILLRIIRDIQRTSEDGVGFVKREQKTAKWFELDDTACRIAVAQAFRDALSTSYKSSKLNKRERQRAERFKVVKDLTEKGLTAYDPDVFRPPEEATTATLRQQMESTAPREGTPPTLPQQPFNSYPEHWFTHDSPCNEPPPLVCNAPLSPRQNKAVDPPGPLLNPFFQDKLAPRFHPLPAFDSHALDLSDEDDFIDVFDAMPLRTLQAVLAP